jgi:hypothetical protein
MDPQNRYAAVAAGKNICLFNLPSGTLLPLCFMDIAASAPSANGIQYIASGLLYTNACGLPVGFACDCDCVPGCCPCVYDTGCGCDGDTGCSCDADGCSCDSNNSCGCVGDVGCSCNGDYGCGCVGDYGCGCDGDFGGGGGGGCGCDGDFPLN